MTVANDDDDLPVLTQVLRIGSGRREMPVPPPVPRAPIREEPEPPHLLDELIIGNEPKPVIEPYVPLPDATPPVNRGYFPDEDAHDGSALDFGVPSMESTEPAATTPAPPALAFEPTDLEALASRVHQSVLAALADRIDTEFDARIAQALQSELEVALARLQLQLREQLAEALRDVVRRAVDAEVTRMQEPPQT